MKDLSLYIDHTLLKPTATSEQITKLCEEALEYGFASVCVPPCYVSLASSLLKKSKSAVCTVIGFPLGYSCKEAKIAEAKFALNSGATEIDMVMNLSKFLSKDFLYVLQEIQEIKRLIGENVLKVIIETCYLSSDEKKKACDICIEAKADFVKTSTGFGSFGATLEDIDLLKKSVGTACQIKASGGIKDRQTALAMIEKGASRIGTSSGVLILKEHLL